MNQTFTNLKSLQYTNFSSCTWSQ